ncbi:MAG: hydrogenase 4 subunit B [Thermoleophilia bacterium]|nr:hydrogenase 4 subunit B [Thermoleophilia bacterium]
MVALVPGAPVALSLRVQAAGLIAVGTAGGVCLLDGRSVGSGFTSELEPAVGVDPLSGLMLMMIALVAAPAAAYAAVYLVAAAHPRALAVLTGLFPLALIGVVTARDATLILGAWELMTLVPAAAILVAGGAHGGGDERRAVFEYLAITHIGGAGVWVAVLVLAERGALGDPAGLASAGTGVQTLVAVAGLIGFGTKAGLVPLHSWLPRVHPLAPSSISAVMSGVMVKVALYGMVRLLMEWLGSPAAWVGFAVLALGAVSALSGILQALFQRDLKRLLAFSTIENVGIVTLALGAAVILADRGEPAWAALALAAALLHGLNHAVVKALLFLGAGSLERAGAGRDLDRMGGLLRRMPWTGAAVLTGCLAIAGLPVLSGFASEWATLQALLGLGRQDAVGLALAGGVAAAALAVTVGLGAICFVKVIGLALLGAPRVPGAAEAVETPRGMWAPLAALGAACLALGVAPGLLLPALADLAPGGGGLPRGAGIDIPGTSLPTLGIALALAVAAATLLALRGRRTAAPAPVWACGQAVEPSLAWTSAAFTKPVRLSMWGLLRPEREVEVLSRGGVPDEVRHRGAVPHLIDGAVYAPVLRVALAGAGAARRLQSGSLRLYAGYLVGLVVLLLLLARTGVLG